jgi:hypothetical protein
MMSGRHLVEARKADQRHPWRQGLTASSATQISKSRNSDARIFLAVRITKDRAGSAIPHRQTPHRWFLAKWRASRR